MPKILIDLTSADLEELQNGAEFDWSYTADDGQVIEAHLFNVDSEEG